ncbi:disease resistance protein RPV1-like isoform X1 [Pyrus x bretschneideri]|uniref:disease resistance protein RPV1-like isoform X1 n=1 Tax=Pyrus x bretschneideri TaxID=225117 RepID=UPI00202E18E7|nr:disease resistance protein RPV1-like isoform X1 [Pyrus x bretschneideri]XP_048439812.1 disease resistance protein RPV1-like isoform X1 [Pyrus x bretschneideri]XP_048439813.1 disease resistance protein RPV1-like isoform X1 [Pyrus x bretschneideri]XP_048439814.1 disease resistance protein RPV1-like isoform X1 [Pyrus x bretschneideri]XP_048439815.1 disease resistance protein RPV1-like isoform X1 [Pyrus x bretschneideri]XP_048439816.1 disease resistance protein RPV1-like isoform X1 [Pyrus x bre
MAAAASSSSGSPWKYDVFLNFRGEDTRRCFVSHLYKALNQKAISTFIDAEGLRKGNDLSQLLTAIQDSRVSIVVFSQKYASSTWCLKELVQILDCMDRKNQMVVPVFYEVDPSHVRKAESSFAEAFAKHEGHSNADMEEVRRWRSALTRATNLTGWDSKNCEDDAKLIEEIVKDIFQKLIRASSSKDDDLVEMDSHMHEMDLLLHPAPEMDDIRVVGIWGMGGIGKTTIARAVCEEIACQFEACCFLDNVKEEFSTCGAVHMQEKFLSRILNEKVQSLGTLDRGYRMILKRLQMKKVLIVLDDVDDLFQIETLLGKQHSFGGGSRIIITTRDKLVLSRADAIYSPKVLSGDGALELFSQYAFRTKQPKRDYDPLSSRAVRYAQGLPLALKVLGAFLYNKSVQEWEEVLEKLKKIPQRGIHDVLRTSFDGLDDSEKDIFLDIACFFKGAEKDNATKVLDSCGFYPHTGLRVLIDRALITVSRETLEMHDLLEEMGREIVRKESIKEPGKRSRLWNYEDVHHVLTQNTATEAVESIILDLSFSKPEVVYFSSEAFVKMTKLRLLKIHGDNGYSCENLKFVLHELRSLVWKHFPLKSLPSNFIAKNLVELDMQNSLVEHLWEGAKPLENLKIINLTSSPHLKKTPDFTEAKNLEKVVFGSCKSLFEVHPSISYLKKLVLLDFEYCGNLKIFPSKIGMKSLRTLKLSCCGSLDKFPEVSHVMQDLPELYLYRTEIKELPSSISNLTGLVTLNLQGCKKFKSLPSSISHMKSLEYLDVSGCSKLEKFPEISEVMKNLYELYLDGTAVKELPASILNLTSLVTLKLNDCRELESLPSSISHMKSLEYLDVSGCSKLEKFPEISEVMKNLFELYLDGTAIKELPASILNLTSLVTLKLNDCRELESLPSSISHMKSLKYLYVSGCSKLEKFPEISEVMKKLFKLYLDGTAIKELPASNLNLTSLVTLSLNNCRELESLPSSISHMKSLKYLYVSGCSKLEKFPEISEVMKKLSELYLEGTAIKELPASILNLTSLVTLKLNNCRELESLPSSISHMKSLKYLYVSGCSKLEKFPEISEVRKKLSELYLDGTAIKELPASILNLTSVVTLSLNDCRELESLPSSISHMKSLKYLYVSGCSKLEKFPEISEVMKKLSELYLDGTAIKELPASILNLTSVVTLSLNDCRELESLPSSISHMKSLKYLDVSGCSKLEKFPEI